MMNKTFTLYSKLIRKINYNPHEKVVLAIILLLFAILIGPAFSVSLSTGIMFILATGLAIYRKKVIFAEPWLIFLIFAGVVFGYGVSEALRPAIIEEFLRGTIVNGIILVGLYLYLWDKANQIKSGKIARRRRRYR